jgi:hypothetical protein
MRHFINARLMSFANSVGLAISSYWTYQSLPILISDLVVALIWIIRNLTMDLVSIFQIMLELMAFVQMVCRDSMNLRSLRFELRQIVVEIPRPRALADRNV